MPPPRVPSSLLEPPPFKAPIIVTDINSAELIKHAANSFLALKISYINAISVICEMSGANVQEVANGMGMDARIGRRFLDASLGFGGSCFPKDLSAFIAISEQLGYNFGLLREVQRDLPDDARALAQLIKSLPLRLDAPRPLARARGCNRARCASCVRRPACPTGRRASPPRAGALSWARVVPSMPHARPCNSYRKVFLNWASVGPHGKLLEEALGKF